MHGERFGPDNGDGDKRLTALLREWKTVEPEPAFEAAVWRRIRAQSAPPSRHTALSNLRAWLELRPVWANAIAAAAGILAGVGLAFFAPASGGERRTGDPLLHSETTLAGSYIAMATGEAR